MEFIEKREFFGSARGVETKIQVDDRSGHDFLLLGFEGTFSVVEIEGLLDFLVGKLKKEIQSRLEGKR